MWHLLFGTSRIFRPAPVLCKRIVEYGADLLFEYNTISQSETDFYEIITKS